MWRALWEPCPLFSMHGIPKLCRLHTALGDVVGLKQSDTTTRHLSIRYTTLERQSLFESHRQRRWLTYWSYELSSSRQCLVRRRTVEETLLGNVWDQHQLSAYLRLF